MPTAAQSSRVAKNDPPTMPAGKASFSASAVLIGERIDLRALGEASRLASGPLTLAVEGGGAAVLFRHGCVVFFDVPPERREAFLDRIRPLVARPYAEPETEHLDLRIDPAAREGIEGNALLLQDANIERLQVVADILGKSMVLALYESRVAREFDRVEPFAVNLEQSARGARNARALLRHIGGVLLSQHEMVGRVQVGDKPDLLWEHPDLERLYAKLEDEFDIVDRDAALERKLDLISSTVQTTLELLNTRRALRVEWYIVALIVIEILLTLYQMFLRA